MLNDFRALDFFKENIDWDEVRNKLSAGDWNDLPSNDNVETMLASFLSTLDICKGDHQEQPDSNLFQGTEESS